MNKEDLIVHWVKRTSPNDFSNGAECSLCRSFQTQVVEVPGVYLSVNAQKWACVKLCKSCLTKMVEKLNETMVENFQPDFKKERGNV